MKRIASRLCGCALAIGCAVAPVLGSGRQEVALAMTPDSELDAMVAAFVGDAPGGAFTLRVRDGITTTATAGVASSAGEGFTSSTPFRVASISKPFVATLVLQLVDEGLVDLDAPLSTYLPDTPVGGDVAIRNLMRHRSGLPNYPDAGTFYADEFSDLTRDFTPEELLGYIGATPASPADQQFEYTNTNYVLLGQLIEAVTGGTLDDALSQRITGPLGLTITHFAGADEPPIAGLAGAWYPDVFDGASAAPYDSIATGAWAAGALVSTADELHLFLGALFAGELMSDASLAQMTDPGPDYYGLGLMILAPPSGRPMYGHLGDFPGYQSAMAIDPDNGDAVVVFVNNQDLAVYDLYAEVIADW